MADNLSKLIDELRETRNSIKKVNENFEAKLKPLVEQEADLEQKLIVELEGSGLEAARNGDFTAAINEMTLPKIDDFDKFTVFVLRNKALHLFERRIGKNAYRELLKLRKGKEIPGLSHIVKKSIQLRATGG